MINPKITILALLPLIVSACDMSETEETNDPAPVPTETYEASTCADIQRLVESGELEANTPYTGPNGFTFELLATSSTGDDELDTCLELEAELDAWIERGVPGATIDFRSPKLHFLASRGISNKDTGEAMDPKGLFRIASMSKSHVGVLAALLAVDGVLDLDNSDGHHSLADYLPEVADKIEYADEITVRQLLSHTSGIPDYFGDFGPAWIGHCLESHFAGLPVSEDQALEIVYGEPASFEPGTSAHYSNTGYVLAGMVMTEVLGHPYQEELHTRIFEPLNMADTYAEKADAFDLDRLSHGYRDASEIGLDFEDWFAVDQGYGFANGGLVSTAEDTTAFLRAFLGGATELPGVDHGALGELLRPAASGYSLGASANNGCFGHAGEFSGYSSYGLSCPDSDTTWVGLINSSQPEHSEALTAWSNSLAEAHGNTP